MKRKVLSILLIVTLFLGLTGCTNNSGDKDLKNTNQKVELTKEEQIWKDATDESIYEINMRFINLVDYKYKVAMYKDVKKELIKISSKNAFAEEFLKLYEKSTIEDLFTNDNDVEKYFLYSYMSLLTNHHEGIAYGTINWTLNEEINYNEYLLSDVWYMNFDKNNKMIESSPGEKNFNYYNPNYILKFISKTDSKELYISIKSTKSVYDTYESFECDVYEDYNSILKHIPSNQEKTIMKMDLTNINKVLEESKEFINFYVKYQTEIYYPKFDSENGITGTTSGTYKPNNNTTKPKVGMTKAQVKSTDWGSPNDINIDTYSWGTQEQWVYDDYGYVYFENGIVTSVSER